MKLSLIRDHVPFWGVCWPTCCCYPAVAVVVLMFHALSGQQVLQCHFSTFVEWHLVHLNWFFFKLININYETRSVNIILNHFNNYKDTSETCQRGVSRCLLQHFDVRSLIFLKISWDSYKFFEILEDSLGFFKIFQDFSGFLLILQVFRRFFRIFIEILENASRFFKILWDSSRFLKILIEILLKNSRFSKIL